MDHPLTAEDSYEKRRQFFKNIWDTAGTVGEKDGKVTNKPKVIKTLHLDDQSVVRKLKKQRVKKLRRVCKKLLHFCDRQNTNDMFYEQMASHDQEYRTAKQSQVRKVRKIKRAKGVKSLSTSIQGDSKIETKSSIRSFKIKKHCINSSSLYKKSTSLGATDYYLKSGNTRRIPKHTGANLTNISRKNKNKQLLPLNKLNIN